MKPSAFLLFLAFLLFAGCSHKLDNRVVYSQFAFEENYGNEESKPDTTVFSSLTLGPEWLFPNGPVKGMTYVDERPQTIVHGISLPCPNITPDSRCTASYVGRRIQQRQFAIMIEMFFAPAKGDVAGLLISRDASGSLNTDGSKPQYFFCRIPAGLALRRFDDKGIDTLAETELPDYVTRVYLRMEYNEPTCSFFYRYEGSGPDDWTSVIEDVDLAFLSSNDEESPDAIIGFYAEHSSSS